MITLLLECLLIALLKTKALRRDTIPISEGSNIVSESVCLLKSKELKYNLFVVFGLPLK